MGLFWDDDEIMELQKKLKVSANYHFSNEYLPSLFFFKPFAFADALTDGKKVAQLLTIVFDVMKKDGYDIKPLLKTGFRAKLDKEKKVVGLIFELPKPELETECNFVATVFFDMEPRYFESELYDNGSFGLCGRDKDGGHLNFGSTGGNIKTTDDLWNAIVSMKK